MGYNHYRYARSDGAGGLLVSPVIGADPSFEFYSGGSASINVANTKRFWLNLNTRAFEFGYGSGVSTMIGSNQTGRTVLIQANSADTYPTMSLIGNGNVIFDLPTGYAFHIRDAGVLIGSVALGGGGAGGVLKLKETTTPSATADFGAIYTKADNHLYWQSGAGVEYDLGGA